MDLVALFIGLAVLFVVIFGTIALFESRRKRAIADALQARGFQVTMKPADGEKLIAFTRLSHVPALKQGHSGVKWFATGLHRGKSTWICEHSYTTGSGKNRSTHTNTVVAIGAPDDWAPFSLTAESIFHRWGEKLGLPKDLKLENEAFNKRWRVRAGAEYRRGESSEDTALFILTPEVQQFLIAADSREWWCIGSGRIVCGMPSSLALKDLEKLLDRPIGLTEHLAPEVRALLAAIE